MKGWRNLWWVVVLAFVLGPLSVGYTNGQATGAVGDLAKRMPNNTLGFLTTSGGALLSDQFKQSHLGMLWNDPGVVTFRQAIETELMRLLAQEQGEQGKAWFDLVKNNVLLALKQPLLIGVAEKPAGPPAAGPPIYGFAILDAGANKATIEEALRKLEGMAGPENIVDVKIGNYTFHGPKETDDIPGYWGWVGNTLVFALNDSEGLAIQNLTTAAGANQPAIKALSKVHTGNDILAMHINIEKALKLIQMFIRMEGGDNANMAIGKMEAVLMDLGLKEVKSITSRIGFTRTDLISEAWVEVPQPFTGLLKSLKPINMSLFDIVDGRAFTAGAVNVSLTEIYDTVMQMIQKIAPTPADYQEVQQGIAQFEQQMGFQIRDDFLGSLAGPIVSYSLPAGVMMEAPNGAFCICCQLLDPAKMTKSMTAIETFAKAMTAQDTEGMLQITHQTQGDTTLHVWTIAPLAMLQITPTWVISKNQLFITSHPAMARSALQHQTNVNRIAKSIRRQPGFQQVTQILPTHLLGFSYVDCKVQIKQLKRLADQYWPMAAMVAMQAKIRLPMVLPDITAVADRMGSGCDMLWSQADGLYMRSQGPVPTGGMALVAVGAGVGALIPTAMSARSNAQGAVSLTNVRQICTGCIMYAHENQGKLPATLQEIKSYIGGEEVLESPRKPPSFAGPSYIYVEALAGKKMDQLKYPEVIVIVYENPAYCRDNIIVGFLDGHSEKVTLSIFKQKLEYTYQQLGQPMPDK